MSGIKLRPIVFKVDPPPPYTLLYEQAVQNYTASGYNSSPTIWSDHTYTTDKNFICFKLNLKVNSTSTVSTDSFFLWWKRSITMSNIGSSKISEMYVGSTKIAQAYVGSTLVFQLPAAGYDSYIIHFTWSSSDNLNLAGLHIDGVQPSTSDVTLQYHNGTWQTASSSDLQSAIQWDNNDGGKAFYCDGINITFTNANVPASVQVKTGRWYGGGSMTVTMHVAGVKDGVETDLGYTSNTNAANLIYTVNI